MVEVLNKLENALLLVTSLDRLCRNPESYVQIEEIAVRRNLHIVCFIFPPSAVLSLLMVPSPLTTFRQFARVGMIASQNKSMPSCLLHS